ncbi:hypothetical protein BO70DRAFT_360619 [Aspergillus heteromorphus CBS 117.55]|uniref:Uncharacterized protein n=1 Tax=Aspergillus heteromorphus CBS 117.55 TaxID=1448321 RepID=A0A317WPS7_9EURO|nr:uncharacterized protein BO70DRAFT_360619 [Aspergillus heteromorphus CBS 117.55]PWY86898.1 hypothetical protein BO70DRAFT_360619 [Aspergillus heteromorphus CBS 117.55]
MGDDKLVDLSKVANSLGYTNIASVGNRFRAVRKRHGIMHFESKAGSGITKTTAAEDAQANATNAAEKAKANVIKASDAAQDEEFESEVPTPVKAKATKKAGGRKGAKVSSKPIPATDAPKTETKGRKRGAKLTAQAASDPVTMNDDIVMKAEDLDMEVENSAIKKEATDALME